MSATLYLTVKREIFVKKGRTGKGVYYILNPAYRGHNGTLHYLYRIGTVLNDLKDMVKKRILIREGKTKSAIYRITK